MASITFLTYNIRSLRDDAAAVARTIRDLQPDVACIQEAPRFWRWRSKCEGLARKVTMSWTCGGRDAGANIILTSTRIGIDRTRSALFSRDPGLHQRGTAIAMLRVDDIPFAVAGTHLDGVEEPRLRHIAELHAAIDSFIPAGERVVIAGDVNDVPGSRCWNALLTRGTDAFAAAGSGIGETSSVTHRTRRIDAIFPARGITTLWTLTVDSPDVRLASDHFPVICELEISGRP